MELPKLSNITDAIEKWREYAERAGTHFKCLEPDFDAEQDPPVTLEQEDDETVVRIDGVIDRYYGFSVKRVIQELDEADPKAIRLVINSPGGSYWDGLAFYNDLRRRAQNGVKVCAEVDALCASAATLPFMACDERVVREGSTLMIHRAWLFMFLAGNADELLDFVKNATKGLRSADKGLVQVYKNRTGRTESDVKEMVYAETWMTGQEAVDESFATDYEESGADSKEDDDDAEDSAFVRAMADARILAECRVAVNDVHTGIENQPRQTER